MRRALAPALVCLASLTSAPSATLETLDNRRLEGRITLTENGRLELATAEGSPQQFALDSIRFARLRAPTFSSDALPKGWRAEDLGEVRGSTVEAGGKVTLSVAGPGSNDSRTQTGHYAFRTLRSDGGIAAKIEQVNIRSNALAGIMLRRNLELRDSFVLLGVTSDSKLHLIWRDNISGKPKDSELGPVQFPIWLRLERNNSRERTVTCWRSADGIKWERAGEGKLIPNFEHFPAGGPQLPLLHAGLCITSLGTTNSSPALPGPANASSAVFAEHAVTANALLGEYYAGTDFKDLRFTRLDSKLEMLWDTKPPSPEMSPEHFSARWSGFVQARYSEPYRFHLDAMTDARIWIDGREIPPVRRGLRPPKDYSSNEVALVTGKKHALRIEFKKSQKAAPIRLGWSSPSQNFEIIPAQQISYTYTSASPLEQTITNSFMARGIWLRNGTFLAGEVVSADGSASRVNFAGRKEIRIFNQQIAHIVFRNSRRPITFEAVDGKVGLFFGNGDLLEGEYEGLKGQSVRVTSLLFGVKTASLNDPNLLGLKLNKIVPENSVTELALVDGSLLKVKSLRAAGGKWIIQESILGELAIEEREIAEIRNPQAKATHPRQ